LKTAALWLAALFACASPALAEPYVIVQVQPAPHVFDICGEWFCATWLENTQAVGDWACVIHISATLSAGFRAEIETEMRAACINATLAGAT
jgi:hypothetical protein